MFTFLLLTWVTSAHTHGQNFTWVTLEKELPYTLSDMTATFFPAMGNSIIIVGGCSAKDGNSLDDNNDWYSCNEISDKALKFDYSTETFTSLPSLPVARYRHAAVIVDNQLFLIGGRNATDDLIPEIDVSWLKDSYYVKLKKDLFVNFVILHSSTEFIIYFHYINRSSIPKLRNGPP